MANKNIVIAGGGFAAIAALKRLFTKRSLLSGYTPVIIDRKSHFEFIPLIVDVLAGWLDMENARESLAGITERFAADFINEEIVSIQPESRTIELKQGKIGFEYLLIATGCQTNFFGNESARQNCYSLNSLKDALTVREALLEKSQKKRVNLVVIGGGYTGIEAATNAHYLLSLKSRDFKIYLVEKASQILFQLPDWIRREALKTLEKLNVEVCVNDEVSSFDEDRVYLRSGIEIKDSVCVWNTGIKNEGYLKSLNWPAIKSRIEVDENLKVTAAPSGIYAAGDCAAFLDKEANNILRASINFARGQGTVAAENIIRKITGKREIKYRPFDPGYLVPLTYFKAPGMALGMHMPSFLGFFAHYFMSVYLSGYSDKRGIIRDLVKRIFSKKVNLG